jgi:gluconate 2-dehydrogenase gamma chain
MINRRSFGYHASRGIAALWLTTRWREIDAALAETPESSFQFLSVEESRDLEAMAAQIIPSDGTPGAREAGVIHFIDRALIGFAKDQQSTVREGLTRLRARMARRWRGVTFDALRPSDQIAVMKRLEREDQVFFDVVRGLTVVGMFANPARGGNKGKVGWRLLGFEDRFFWQPPFGEYDQPDPAAR